MPSNLKLRRFILKEMADVLADDALFTKQTPQDDSPVGDVDDETVDEGGDCGCGCGGAPEAAVARRAEQSQQLRSSREASMRSSKMRLVCTTSTMMLTR